MITVVDSLMGSGKSSMAFQMIDDSPIDQNFLYITPFLDEVDRVMHATNRHFKEPKHLDEDHTKYEDIQGLLMSHEDIASTHFLFSKFDEKFKELIEEGEYTLILDEVLDVVEPYTNLKKKDMQLLLDKNLISVDEDGFVIWNDENYVETVYEPIAELALAHQLAIVDNRLLLWHYPKEIFTAFKDVYVLTYLFEASIMKAYFDLYGLKYEKKSVKYDVINKKFVLTDYFVPDLKPLRDKIHIYMGKLNENISQKDNVLSSTWVGLDVNNDDIKQIKNNIYNYLQNITKSHSDSIIWTTYKDMIAKFKGKGYSDDTCFVACNSRATNNYADRYILVYIVNRYMHPMVAKFFQSKGIKVDNDLFALAEMVQWIWRSRIRKGEEVYIYIPAKRMRTLLADWLYGLIYQTKIK